MLVIVRYFRSEVYLVTNSTIETLLVVTINFLTTSRVIFEVVIFYSLLLIYSSCLLLPVNRDIHNVTRVGVSGAPVVSCYYVSAGRAGNGQTQLPGDRRIAHQDTGRCQNWKYVCILLTTQSYDFSSDPTSLWILNFFNDWQLRDEEKIGTLHCVSAIFEGIWMTFRRCDTVKLLLWFLWWFILGSREGFRIQELYTYIRNDFYVSFCYCGSYKRLRIRQIWSRFGMSECFPVCFRLTYNLLVFIISFLFLFGARFPSFVCRSAWNFATWREVCSIL